METIPKSDCTSIGYFQKPHGVKGELVLITEEEYLDALENSGWLFVELDDLLVPFRVREDGIRVRSNTSALVSLDWVPDQDYAKRLSGKKVFLNTNEILPDGNIRNIRNLIGFRLFGAQEGLIGTITSINDYSGNMVLTVIHEKREFLIPFHEDLIKKLTIPLKKITLTLPEGLIG